MSLSVQLFWMNWYFFCHHRVPIQCCVHRSLEHGLERETSQCDWYEHLIKFFFPFYYLHCVIVLNARFNCLLDVFLPATRCVSADFFLTRTKRKKDKLTDEGSFRWFPRLLFSSFPFMSDIRLNADENMQENRKFKLLERWDCTKKKTAYSLIDADMKIQKFHRETSEYGHSDAAAIDTHLRMPNENSDKHEKKAKLRKIIMMKCN